MELFAHLIQTNDAVSDKVRKDTNYKSGCSIEMQVFISFEDEQGYDSSHTHDNQLPQEQDEVSNAVQGCQPQCVVYQHVPGLPIKDQSQETTQAMFCLNVS